MNESEVVIKGIAERVGGQWKSERDRDFWCIKEASFIVEAEPFIRRLPNVIWLGFDCALGHTDFGKIANMILGDKPSEFVSIKAFQKNAEVSSDGAIPPGFEQLMREILLELQSESINHYIDEFRSVCPSGPSMPQVWHLAALAWASDADVLFGYQRNFQLSNKMNFVPMITQEMIDRAFDIAVDRLSNKDES